VDINDIAQEMRIKADAVLFYPDRVMKTMTPHQLREFILQFQRKIVVDGYEIFVTLTRTVVCTTHYYQVSIGNTAGEPNIIPVSVVEKVVNTFVPNSIPIPSALGNCIQFIERII
jgi:hypothetical protein